MTGRRASAVAPAMVRLLAAGAAAACSALPEAPAIEHVELLAGAGGAVVCTSFGAQERFVAASPEGHGWLLTDNGVNTVVRVVDPYVSGPDVVRALEVVGVQQVRAWSESEATLLTPTTVWQLGDDFVRTRVSTPDGFDGAASSCGDLWQDGFVALPDRLVRHRGGSVFSWAFGDYGALPEALLARDGACVGPDGVLWGIERDGTLWNIDDEGARTTVQIGSWVDATAAADAVAVATPYTLWLGSPDTWGGYALPGPAPTTLAAGGTDVWMLHGADIVRARAGRFTAVPSPLEEPVAALEAHAAGVWVLGETSACHVALEGTVRTRGVRPHWRTRDGGFGFQVRPLPAAAQDAAPTGLEATLDGEPLSLTYDAESGWFDVEGQLNGNRWHRFEFTAEGTDARRVDMERAPALVQRSWEADVRPLYENSCTGMGCHDAGSVAPSDLSTHAAWVERADAIRQRVVVGESMPPPSANQADGWGASQIDIVSEWLEGGMDK